MSRPAIRIRDSGGARSGRICLHDWEVNDKIPDLGNNLELDTIHSDLVRSTEQKKLTDGYKWNIVIKLNISISF